ncbi:hypothetical protein DVK44_14505 [Streptomyces paludis]|uniref:Uncharacterized protein n=1 Tax=Streptomyces paludis TaxID=2282738 RepID=A0A345HPU9_9ACTN|nr:hypothetical protein [Streptomyces paludis]AXG78723.1 hypothetical protein DVK44_14505 [Streptomyces paludis]
MSEQDTDAPGSAEPSHLTSTFERGSFCLARCSCGWSGPARRSRDLARTDAATHPQPSAAPAA